MNVNSTDLFKARIDNFWSCQDVMCDWTADLARIGDRSECAMLNAQSILVKSYIRDGDIQTRRVCVRFIIDYYYYYTEGTGHQTGQSRAVRMEDERLRNLLVN